MLPMKKIAVAWTAVMYFIVAFIVVYFTVHFIFGGESSLLLALVVSGLVLVVKFWHSMSVKEE
jgi:hypothetical protein